MRLKKCYKKLSCHLGESLSPHYYCLAVRFIPVRSGKQYATRWTHRQWTIFIVESRFINNESNNDWTAMIRPHKCRFSLSWLAHAAWMLKTSESIVSVTNTTLTLIELFFLSFTLLIWRCIIRSSNYLNLQKHCLNKYQKSILQNCAIFSLFFSLLVFFSF